MSAHHDTRRPPVKKARRHVSRRTHKSTDTDNDLEPPSKAQIRELNRRIKDFDDPRQFMIISPLTKRFILYYDAANNLWAMDREAGSRFKKREVAEAVAGCLGDRVRLLRVVLSKPHRQEARVTRRKRRKR